MSREVGPRVGRPVQVDSSQAGAQAINDDPDIEAYFNRTPKTNEQLVREKQSTGWEFNVWIVVIIVVVIVLLMLVVWFVLKKDSVTESKPPPQQQNVVKHDTQHDEKLAEEARNNLAKKTKKAIGPVPGELPDNPEVVGVTNVNAGSAHVGTTGVGAGSTNVGSNNTGAPGAVAQNISTNQESAQTQNENTTETETENLPEINSQLVKSRLATNLGLIE